MALNRISLRFKLPMLTRWSICIFYASHIRISESLATEMRIFSLS